jgi:hypothetical protein
VSPELLLDRLSPSLDLADPPGDDGRVRSGLESERRRRSKDGEGQEIDVGLHQPDVSGGLKGDMVRLKQAMARTPASAAYGY